MSKNVGSFNNYYDSELKNSEYDSLELLTKRYFNLLFYIFSGKNPYDGLQYMTNRNGLLAKIVLQYEGFVNYIQSDFGKWDYDNPKYRRIVSPNFVLYSFNERCCDHVLSLLSHISFDATETNYLNIIKYVDKARKNIINGQSHTKEHKEHINYREQFLYYLITEFFDNLISFSEKLRENVEFEEERPSLTLPSLIDHIRMEAAKKLRTERIQFKKAGAGYDNPIKVISDIDLFETPEIDDEDFGVKYPYDSNSNNWCLPYMIIVDYKDSKDYVRKKI